MEPKNRNPRVARLLLAAVAGVAAASLPYHQAAGEEAAPAAAQAQPDAKSEGKDASPATPQPTGAAPAAAAERPEPKPLSDQVKKGLAWLVEHQQDDGGWNQGEASAKQGRGGEVIDKSNVADTCMAALTLLRAGSTPSEGEYAENLRKAADFVCGQVEKSSQEGLLVTDIKVTRVQSKLGRYVDTFAAALFLAEIRNAMPDEPSRARVVAALDKVMDKIEKNQKEDGQFVDAAGDGWAGALCQSLGHKALNRAAQNGQAVDDDVLARAERYALKSFDAKTGKVSAAGSANVELYARAANLDAFQESSKTNAGRGAEFSRRREQAQQQAAQAEEELAEAEQAGEKDRLAKAAAELKAARAAADAAEERIVVAREGQKALQQAQAAVVRRLGDKRFVAGFGSNGGEEFLSYMQIGESLLAKGGEDFAKWDKAMTENLNRVQNDDGSWSGHHCITGRTFCTSTALLTLMVDRATAAAPAAGKIDEAAGTK